MSKGFIFCAVACSALALAVYAGLFEFLGISATAAVLLLIGICLLFHGAAIYMLKPRTKAAGRFEIKRPEERASGLEMDPIMKENRPAAGSSPERGGVPVMASDGTEAPELPVKRLLRGKL